MQDRSQGGQQKAGKRLMVTFVVVAVMAVLAVFLLVMWLNNRSNDEIDGPQESGSAVTVIFPGEADSPQGRV